MIIKTNAEKFATILVEAGLKLREVGGHSRDSIPVIHRARRQQ